jgi:hypothetical protein
MKTQVKLVFACTALHNFLNQYGIEEEEEESDDVDETTSNNTAREDVDSEDAESLAMTRRREEIAQLMWDQYCQVLNARIQ